MAGYVLKCGIILSVPACISTVIFSLYHSKKRAKISTMDLLCRCLFATYCCFLFSAVFVGRPHIRGTMLIPFSSYYEAWITKSFIGWRNILLDIVMFIPFGILFPICRKREINNKKFIVIVILVSLSIETVQYISHTGVFEIDDLTNNLFGALIGFEIWKLLRKK